MRSVDSHTFLAARVITRSQSERPRRDNHNDFVDVDISSGFAGSVTPAGSARKDRDRKAGRAVQWAESFRMDVSFGQAGCEAGDGLVDQGRRAALHGPAGRLSRYEARQF